MSANERERVVRWGRLVIVLWPVTCAFCLVVGWLLGSVVVGPRDQDDKLVAAKAVPSQPMVMTAPSTQNVGDLALQQNNQILFAQQLDQLFNKLGSGLSGQQPAQATLVEILRVFYLYDREFLRHNERNNAAKEQVAYATQRAALCAKLLGLPDQSS